MLFTAIAATVVMLPWAINGLPGDDERPALEAPKVAQQPLTGLGSGETIREIHQDTPFSMVALTAQDLTGTSARVRAKADLTKARAPCVRRNGRRYLRFAIMPYR